MFYPKEATPLSGVALSLYTDVYFVVKPYFVLRYITVSRIISAPGTGYSLMEGYFLPPISFTVEEAVTLLIGTDFIEQRDDDDYRVRANAARRKIEAALSESVRNETSRIRRALRLLAPGKQVASSTEREYLEIGFARKPKKC
jgi:predicted DNA-binding transcriptional regulator YafY